MIVNEVVWATDLESAKLLSWKITVEALRKVTRHSRPNKPHLTENPELKSPKLVEIFASIVALVAFGFAWHGVSGDILKLSQDMIGKLEKNNSVGGFCADPYVGVGRYILNFLTKTVNVYNFIVKTDKNHFEIYSAFELYIALWFYSDFIIPYYFIKWRIDRPFNEFCIFYT